VVWYRHPIVLKSRFGPTAGQVVRPLFQPRRLLGKSVDDLLPAPNPARTTLLHERQGWLMSRLTTCGAR
jgi:hypothetical protein